MAPHPDLEAEQAHIARAYQELADMRARSQELLREALAQGGKGTPQAVEEREVMVRVSLQRLEQLDLGRESLCFGRIDRTEGDTFHIGRLAVASDGDSPLVVDWRAPVAEPFYRATGRHPLGLTLRRHFLTEGERLIDIEDERFSAGDSGDELGLAGSGALVAALERSRSGRMRDIVATVQREQDEVIRAPLTGLLIVQGAPGTGKTAVALHRAAYLLYTHRFPLERQGVLVVGPNPLFLRYIEHVLPSLGESGVALTTPEGMSTTRVRGVDLPAVAAVKAKAEMATVLRRAVRDRQRGLRQTVEVPFGAITLRITPEMSGEIVQVVKRRPGTHNSRRRQVETQLWRRLHTQYAAAMERAVRTGMRGEGEDIGVEEVGRRARRQIEVATALDRMWPVLTPHELLHDLFGAPALVHLAGREQLTLEEQDLLLRPRSESAEAVPWTAADIPLLDEAAVLLGPVKHQPGTDEGPRTYGHIVVDEAQDLTPMQLRMLARRSISGSLTIVGDLAQATGHWSPEGWEEVARHLGTGPGTVVELTVNYRTPREIMDLAGRVLAVTTPHLRQPESVRASGEQPDVVAAPEGGVAAAAAAAVARLATGGSDNVGLICPSSLAASLGVALADAGVAHGEPDRHGLDEQVTLVPIEVAKGLEFDSVVVVEPARLVREAPQGLRALYVALTRATKRLTIVHAEPLPGVLRAAPEPAA
ncbi:MAG TPA: ATP-binding domain-containing protein [Acidimicrobiales bacterium]|nr:ATP-binding domain-containing protein [Acidimicrobiales bacterium]